MFDLNVDSFLSAMTHSAELCIDRFRVMVVAVFSVDV